VSPVPSSSFSRKLDTLKPLVSRVLLFVTLLVSGGAARSYATIGSPLPRVMHLGSGSTSHRLPDRSGIPSTPHRSHARRASRLSLSSLPHSRSARSGQRSAFHGYDANRRFSPVAQGFSLTDNLERDRSFIDLKTGRGPPRASPYSSIPLGRPRLFFLIVFLVFLSSLAQPRFLATPEVGPFLSTTSISMQSLPEGPSLHRFPGPPLEIVT
jgi:hypothetical protein